MKMSMPGDEIARYLDGVMSAAERMRFEARMTAQRRLREQVEAERAIRATIERQVAAMPTEHTAARNGMLAALDALPRTPAPPPPSVPPSGASSLLRWLGAAGAGAVIVVGGYYVATQGDSRPSAHDSISGADRNVVVAPIDTLTAGDSITSAASTRMMAAPVDSPRARSERPADAGPATLSASPSPAASNVARERDTAGTSGSDSLNAGAPRRLRVIDRDSVKVRVGVEKIEERP